MKGVGAKSSGKILDKSLIPSTCIKNQEGYVHKRIRSRVGVG